MPKIDKLLEQVASWTTPDEGRKLLFPEGGIMSQVAQAADKAVGISVGGEDIDVTYFGVFFDFRGLEDEDKKIIADYIGGSVGGLSLLFPSEGEMSINFEEDRERNKQQLFGAEMAMISGGDAFAFLDKHPNIMKDRALTSEDIQKKYEAEDIQKKYEAEDIQKKYEAQGRPGCLAFLNPINIIRSIAGKGNQVG